MKIRPILIAFSLIMLLDACSPKNEIIQTQTPNPEPNVVAICIDSTSAILHPSNIFDWLTEHQPQKIYVGQINMFRVGTNIYAATAPHVLSSPKMPSPFPTSTEIEGWTNSVDGKEIAFAKLRDWRKLGFGIEPVEVREPQPNMPATLKSTMFVSSEEGVKNLEMEGTLEIVSSPEQIKLIGETMTPGSSFRERLLHRAPTRPFFTMVVHEQNRKYLVGSSGAFVWQNGHPVGVFVAAYFTDDMPPLTYIEPLLDSVVASKL